MPSNRRKRRLSPVETTGSFASCSHATHATQVAKKTFYCVCTKDFTDKRKRDKHVKTFQPESWQCPECLISHVTGDGIMRHMQRQHAWKLDSAKLGPRIVKHKKPEVEEVEPSLELADGVRLSESVNVGEDRERTSTMRTSSLRWAPTSTSSSASHLRSTAASVFSQSEKAKWYCVCTKHFSDRRNRNRHVKSYAPKSWQCPRCLLAHLAKPDAERHMKREHKWAPNSEMPGPREVEHGVPAEEGFHPQLEPADPLPISQTAEAGLKVADRENQLSGNVEDFFAYVAGLTSFSSHPSYGSQGSLPVSEPQGLSQYSFPIPAQTHLMAPSQHQTRLSANTDPFAFTYSHTGFPEPSGVLEYQPATQDNLLWNLDLPFGHDDYRYAVPLHSAANRTIYGSQSLISPQYPEDGHSTFCTNDSLMNGRYDN